MAERPNRKRWTMQDDIFMVEFAGANCLGGSDLQWQDFIAMDHLQRAEGSGRRRVAVLKATGAWDVLEKNQEILGRLRRTVMEAELTMRREYREAIGLPHLSEEELLQEWEQEDGAA